MFCLFDIDGTLLRSGGAGQSAMEETMRVEFGIDQIQGEIKTAGRTDRAIVSELIEQHNLTSDEITWKKFQDCYFRLLPGFLQQLDGAILPGVIEILGDLSIRPDIEVGLLTGNFRNGANIKLSHFGISHHFEFGGFGDRHHHRDDVAREAVDEIQSRFGVQANGRPVVIIGDTPADIRCARAVNATAIAVATGVYQADDLQKESPDHLFEDFSDVARFLQLLS